MGTSFGQEFSNGAVNFDRIEVGSSVTTFADWMFCSSCQETNSKKKEERTGKGRKWCTTSVDDRRTKIPCFRDKRLSWTSNRSDLSGAGVSVSSKTVRSRLADVRLKGNFCEKSRISTYSSAKKDYSGQSKALIGQIIIGHKLYRGTKLKYR
ncbi:hypothetical protein TNCV_1885851 [Trichonephila clavipes]|nr:hypothetical protein TNCV_1885851 [Trichonephila clavipes]